MRLGWRTRRVDSLKLAELAYTRTENTHKVCKKTFVFNYVAAICTTTGRTEQIRVMISSLGGLYVCAGRFDIDNLLKYPLIYSVSYFNLGALGLVWKGKPHLSTIVAGRFHPSELPISDESRNNAHVASTGVKLH